MDLGYEFNRIFAGNQRAHGEFVIKAQKGAKATGKAATIKSPPNEDLWRKHLAGETGLGVVPITENSTCTWGAIDIDEYEGLDLEDLSFKIPAPLVLCRSKSGGLHVYLFTQAPVTSTLLRKKLTLAARALGHPNAEIFPKQDTLNDGDIGNWINMPYFNAATTTRYCLKGGIALSAEEFVSHVAEHAINMQQLVELKFESIADPDADPEFEDAPPCLQYLVKNGFPVGSRNSALFSLGVYARMKFASGWEDKVFEYNQRFMNGSYSEVAGIIRSLNKKSYVYKCKDQPLLSVCDKDKCSECTYGVQPSKDDEKTKRPCILDLVDRPVKCYAPVASSKDDPYWVFNINGIELNVTVDMCRSQSVFAREYLRQFHRVILPIKDSKWVKELNEILEEAIIKQLAPDAGPEGQMLVHLEEFCTNKAKAKVKDEMLLGKPWHEEERIYFRSGDFLKYLDQQRFRAIKGDDIFPILKRGGAKHHQFLLKGKNVKCWSIIAFDEQTEDFDREEMSDDTEY